MSRAWIAAALALACTAAPPAPPDVLLVTIDTLRPDALGWVAAASEIADANETPTLDALAHEGAAFPRAVSPVPLTLPAHASILTGLYPRRHGVEDNDDPLPEDVATLAERLRDAGYATAAFIAGFPLRREHGLDAGFDLYDDALPVSAQGGWETRPASDVARAYLSWSERRGSASDSSSASGPTFSWVHFYDPHDPYEPPPEIGGDGARGRYEGEVRYVDRELAPLLAAARRAAGSRGLLTIVTADHGESLGEHGEATHGFFVYDSTVLVPLVLHWPERIRPRALDAPVRLVDLAPTVLDLLGLPAVDGADGQSFAPLLAATDDSIEWPGCWIESLYSWRGYGWSPLAAFRTSTHKVIRAPRSELYDLVRDPDEQHDLWRAGEPATDEWSERLRAEERSIVSAVERDASTTSVTDDTADATDALRSLGYLSGAASGRPPATQADPKDRLAEKRALDSAEEAVRRGDIAGALAAFDAVTASDPDNRAALQRRGEVLLDTGRAALAARDLERLVELDPAHAEALFRLGEARLIEGDAAGAAFCFRRVVELQPRRAAAWSNLAAATIRSGDASTALAAARSAVELEPASPLYRDNLEAIEDLIPSRAR